MHRRRRARRDQEGARIDDERIRAGGIVCRRAKGSAGLNRLVAGVIWKMAMTSLAENAKNFGDKEARPKERGVGARMLKHRRAEKQQVYFLDSQIISGAGRTFVPLSDVRRSEARLFGLPLAGRRFSRACSWHYLLVFLPNSCSPRSGFDLHHHWFSWVSRLHMFYLSKKRPIGMDFLLIVESRTLPSRV